MLPTIIVLACILQTRSQSLRSSDISKWMETKWSECIPRGNCLKPGYRTKQIHCVDNQNAVVDDKRCKSIPLHKPRIVYSSCVPKTCLWMLKKFLKTRLSPWGECSAVTLNSWNTIKHKLQDRNGTMEFPDCEKDAVGVAFVRRRELLCKIRYPATTGGEGKISVDVEAAACGKTFHLNLTKWRFCFFACVNTCALSQWAPWATCHHCRKPRTRYRTRTHMSLLLPNMDKFMNYCPHMAKIKPRKELASTKSVFHQFKVFPWDKGRRMRERKKNGHVLLQTTVKQRKIECIDRNGHRCNQTSADIMPKTVMVDDYDCLMTSWTSWGTCRHHKGAALATRSTSIATALSHGVEERRRTIKTLPLGEGKKCGDVTEYRSCNVSAKESGHEYRYDEGQWSQCMAFNGPNVLYDVIGCRVTFKWRSVYCYHHSNERREPQNRTPVPEHFCRHRKKPASESLCDVKCPDKCVYENWSTWSHCTRNNIKRRFKSSIINDNECPRISQKRHCGFHWVKTLNHACVALSPAVKCGLGYYNHTIHCLNGGRNIVDQTFCDSNTKPTQYEQCDISCPNDTAVEQLSSNSSDTAVVKAVQQQQLYPYHLIKDFLAEKEEPEPLASDAEDYYWYPSHWGESVPVPGGRASYTRHCTLENHG